MTFGMAAVLLILIIAGIILAVRGLQQRKILCIIIIVLLSVFGLALAVYMGLTMLFVDAVRSQPPVKQCRTVGIENIGNILQICTSDKAFNKETE